MCEQNKVKLHKLQTQNSFNEDDWGKLICIGKIRLQTHSDLNKYLQHYSIIEGLVVSDLRLETRDSRFESSCYLGA